MGSGFSRLIPKAAGQPPRNGDWFGALTDGARRATPCHPVSSMKLLALLSTFLTVASLASQAGKIYFTDRGRGTVQRLNLDGSSLETLSSLPGSNLRGITLDLDRGKLYFCDNGGDDIYCANLDGSNRVAIVSEDLGFPADLTLDPAAGKLYWCDRNRDRIERANVDGSERETVITADQPYYLDLDLEGGKIYWGHFSQGSIYRADLTDGRNIETVVSGLTTVRQVKLDPAGGYLYWCDRNAVPARIQRRHLDGGPVENIYLGLDTPHGMTLDVPAGKIYWADTGTNNRSNSTGANAICRGDMNGSGPIEILATVSQPWDVVVDPTITSYENWRQRFLPIDALHDHPGDDADGDGIINVLAYALGRDPPVFTLGPPRLKYAIRNDVTDLTGLRIEISTDLRNWRHNEDGGDPVTLDFQVPGPPGSPFQFLRTEIAPPFRDAPRLYYRFVLPLGERPVLPPAVLNQNR